MNSNYNCRKQYFGLILFLSFVTFSFGQNIMSDKSDYYPGELATFTGSGFAPNELIDLVVLHYDETPNSGENHEHWEVQTDENGAFITTWIVCTDDCLGSTLRAYATGMSSNLQAWVEFTDANVKFSFTGITGYNGNITLNYRVYPTGSPGGNFTPTNISYTNPSSMTAIAVSNSQTIEYNTNSIVFNGNTYTSASGTAVGANNGGGAQTIPITFNLTCTSPTITCPSNIVANSESNSCGKSVSFNATSTGTNPTITYKIGATAITSPHVFPGGTTIVNATATNSCGTSTCTFTVTVNDAVPPIISSSGTNKTIECGTQLIFNIPTATDNCDQNPQIIEVSDITTPSSCSGSYSRIKSWKARDISGNESQTISQTINVIDTIAPVAPSAPPTASYQCIADVPSAESLTALDNCSGSIAVVGSDSVDSSNPCHVVITRTWTFTDACNNSSSVSQIINVIDTIAPVAPNAPATASYQCIADVPSAESLTALDNCSGSIAVVGSDSVDSSNPCHVIITRTWTFTDACNNSSSVSQIINVIDTIAPVVPNAPATASYQCIADVPGAESLTALDNCSGSIAVVGSDSVDSSNPCHVVITRTWTFTDACNNSSSVSQTIYVIDTIAPVAPSAPVTASYQCIADVPSAESLTALDNCSGSIAVVGSDSVDSSNPCHVIITRTWTFTDACNNSSSVSQTINVIDTIAPVVPSAPATASYQCIADVPSAESLTALDNCSGSIAVVGSDSVDSSNPCHVVITRTWTFTDACNNSSSVSQTINIIDTIAPVVPSAPATASYQCIADVPSAESLTALDNCSGSIAVVGSDSVDSSNPCHVVITRTWTFTDACNNSSSVSQIINVIDTIAPVAPNAPATASYQCIADVPSAESLTALDNCSGSIAVVGSDSVDSSNPCHVVITRTWTFTDTCNNSSSVSQIINVIDTIAPVAPNAPATASYQCIADVPSAESLTALDNCSGSIAVVGSDSVDSSNPCHVVITRTWTFTDACNNSSSVSQTINVIDTIAPVAPNAPATASYQCIAEVPSAESLTALDNCSGSIAIVGSDSVDSSNPCHVVITRTWTFTDTCNNSSSVSQTINVIDTTPPSFSKPADITIYTNSSCGYNANVSVTGDVTNETDNCATGIQATYSDAINNGTCVGSKIITRTWSLVDNCNNSAANQTQTITVLDNTAPTFTKPADITIYTNSSCGYNANVSVTGDVTNEADNCSSGIQATYSDAINNGTCVGSKIITRTWSLVDNCNNSAANQIQTITVLDNTAPTITCPVNLNNLTTDTGLCTKTLTALQIGTPATNDSCSTSIVSWLRSDGANSITAPYPLGTTTITWTAKDSCNNQTSCVQTIEVTKIAPTIMVTTSVSSQQYSDLVSFYAQLSVCNGYAAGGTVTFKLGATPLGTVNVNSLGYAELPNVPMLFAPNTYTVTAIYNCTSPYLSASGTSNLTITCEDAVAFYTGSSYVSTSSATSSNATVTLSATIKDISAVDNSEIPYGNITNAKVTFINRDTNTIIASNLLIGLVSLGDTKVGTATYNWNTSITGDSQSITIGIIITGYYCRDIAVDDEIVTISKPLGDLFITGGGYLVMNNSSGIKAGTSGTKNNFGFNVKYNKNKTSLQGNINTIIRKLESDGMHTYQIKGNSMTSLSVITTCPKKATFIGKANIQDITNPLNVIGVDGNATLQVTMTDNGEPGNFDTIGITVWNKNGGLWFSSNWNGTTTIEQTIGGGNVKVHGGSICGAAPLVTQTNTPTMKNVVPEEESITWSKPEIKIWPNPSNSDFNLEISNKIENYDVNMEVFDQNGRLIQQNIFSNEKLNFGKDLQSGLYFIKITNGNFQETKRVLKN